MTDNLSGVIAFVKTAETLSFVGAARALGVSASAVGKNVAKLEASLNVRLLHRSTRKVSLTAEGQLFYERCRKILDDLHDARAMLSHAIQAPRGKLRVSLPTIGYRFLFPHMLAFRQTYPEIELELDFNDHLVDVIEGGLRRSDPQWRPRRFKLDGSQAGAVQVCAMRIPRVFARARSAGHPRRS